MRIPDKNLPEKTTQDFPVVGIGASAGGLDAFKKIVKAIPKDSGMAYVLLQHLSPNHESNLPEILALSTELPVHEIINDINLSPNHIYIIPENNYLIADNGVLKLEPGNRTLDKKKKKLIDVFFESLAEVHNSYAIGVVLSGTAFDGTLGLKRIKEKGGATIAQDPKSASFKGMPQSAINADTVDYILTPENIPGQLLNIRNSYMANNGYNDGDEITESEGEVLKKILNLILLRSGNDFHHYKQATIRRRIARRMVISQRENLQDYYNFLRNDKNEQDLLFNDLLIPVTYFFRDEFFDSLDTLVFPHLLEKAVNKNIRIWVAGCSTGEEAFSLAIVLHEYLLKTGNKDIKVQIFASDISENSIAKARTAIYSAQDIQQVSETRIQNYFTKKDGNYQINKVIRDMCVFAVHNFVKDPPFAKIDLVSCRNVLIYLDSYLQQRAMETFHYSLKEKGILFLGKSESASIVPDHFEPVSKQEKIYIRKFTPSRNSIKAFKSLQQNGVEKKLSTEKNSLPEDDFRKIASDLLFKKHNPVGVVINEHHEIIRFYGDISPFLLPSSGKASFNILKMAREGISFELRHALMQIKETNETVIKEDILVKNQPYRASFELVPIENSDNHIIVFFYKKELQNINIGDESNEKNNDQQQRIQDLEAELLQLYEDIKRVTDEQHTAFEELQTTNEELLSSSEELQALNEELETTAEELQSNNEELMCVNDELMDRQGQLIALQNYLESIIRTIHEPLLIIDTDFVIKSANPAFYKFFKTTELETEGQNFFAIGECQWNIPELRQQLSQLLNARIPIKNFKVETLCPNIGKKVIKINAQHIVDDKPSSGMILLALEDITDLTSTNDLLTQRNEELQKHNEQLETFSSAASHDLQDPLRKIHMFCNKIIENDKNLSDSTKHDLERIKFSLNNMSQLISDLIGYSKTNFVEKEYKKTDMNALLNKTVRDLKDDISETSAIVTVSPLPVLNVIPFQIQQLFSNLIMNSIKYAKAGIAPEIRIESNTPSANEIIELKGNPRAQYVRITISDNGIGFSQEYEDKIFEPFYRLHSKNNYRGSGLGLALVKKIINNHNGFIKVNSKINQGTQFSIFLPSSNNIFDPQNN